MERRTRSLVDRRARRIISVLRRSDDAPVTAARLGCLIGIRSPNRESVRRQVREAVTRAREMMREVGAEGCLTASPAGYKLSTDHATVVAYLQRRRAHALGELAETCRERRSIGHARSTGQQTLFEPGMMAGSWNVAEGL